MGSDANVNLCFICELMAAKRESGRELYRSDIHITSGKKIYNNKNYSVCRLYLKRLYLNTWKIVASSYTKKVSYF